MKLSAFDFNLPKHLIAQHPLPERDQSRLMVVHRKTGKWQSRVFRELPEILGSGRFLVLNNTRVFPARLWACRPGKGERIEVLLVREEAPGAWLALLRPARKAPAGEVLFIESLRAQVMEARADGTRLLRFDSPDDILAVAEESGEPPLPPYILRQPREDLSEDKIRYQTIFARHTGSVAAPTAGLHFTPGVFRDLDAAGIQRCEIMLHIGYGTFQPVRCSEIEEHRMDSEYFEVNDEAAACIGRWKSSGLQLVAVGSTVTRVLEESARRPGFPGCGCSGYCDLFIYPGFEFLLLDGLLTNFHLPRSTLFMLVSAFAGRELMLSAYQEAIRECYRFFSYGDCMLIL